MTNTNHIALWLSSKPLLAIAMLKNNLNSSEKSSQQYFGFKSIIRFHTNTISDFLNDLFVFLLADNEFIYRNQNGTVILRNVETNSSTILIENKKIVSIFYDK